MLTGELLRVRATARGVSPSFVDPTSDRLLERAQKLMELVREAAASGWTRASLEEAVGELIGDDVDHKLTRGLARLLAEATEADTAAPEGPLQELTPADLRTRLFERVGSRPGRVTSQRAMEALAEELGAPVEALWGHLYADRPEEQRVGACAVTEPVWLLHRYNVALVQALLVRAEEVTVELDGPSPERLRQLFRQVKFHGLMYRVERADAGPRVVLDGPTSLLRQSTRYGLALASWFPGLLHQPGPWRLAATVRWGPRKLRKALTLDHTLGLCSHTADTGAWVSRTEQWFAERFEALDSGWTLEREGVVLDLGGEAVVAPDFTFRKDGRVAYLDIVGTWRRGWLERRLALLEAHGPGNLVLAVSRKLAAGKEAVPHKGPVVEFTQVVPAREVLQQVERVALPP